MRTEFENVSRKLVLISACHDTIISPPNPFLIQTLVKAREAGHMVIITSSRRGLGSVTELIWPKYGKAKDFCDVTLDGTDWRVVPKQILSHALDQLGIEKADFVFEAKDPFQYLHARQIGAHVDPKDFFPGNTPSGDFLRLRMALADPAP